MTKEQQRAKAIFDYYWDKYLMRKKQRERMMKELTVIVGRSRKIIGIEEFQKKHKL